MRDETPTDNRIDWALLERYFAGHAGEEESAYVADYLARHPDKASVLRGLQHEVGVEGQYPRAEESLAAYGKLSNRLGFKTAKPAVADSSTSGRQRSWIAALAIAAGLAGLLIVGKKEVSSWLPYTTTPPRTSTYITAATQRASVTLADGSQVILAPATTIRVTGRNVQLDGEAIFTINQQSKTPFTVKAGSSVTRVLGTEFGVRKYADDASARIVVASGKVSVGSVVLTPGLQAVVSGNTNPVITRADVARVTAWRNNELSFDRAQLSDVIPELARWYGIEVRVTDKAISSLPLTATFRSPTAKELAYNLQAALGVRAEYDGNILTLKP